ncbi:YtzH-like family protein [Bacillus sp. FSL K6-3431]|uniref:YtzH-like family protein n=1 Tax=Bacillus sp. FSL K6-3431 TaxID=2921500 RepID=UPI0030F9B63A
MSLTHNNQVQLLEDILNNHLEDCCGTVSECQQLERLVQSLLGNQAIPEQMQPLLENIYAYCQEGCQSNDLNNHIHSNQEQLSQWVGEIDTYSALL